MKGYQLLFTVCFFLLGCANYAFAQSPVITPKSQPIKLALNANGTLTVPLESVATVTASSGESLTVQLSPATADCSNLGPQNITVTAKNTHFTPANVKFNKPKGLATDAAGNIYVADYGNGRIRKISTTGAVTTYAGSTPGYSDGPAASAQFLSAYKTTVDNAGNVYVAEGVLDPAYGITGGRIRKISPSGAVSTLAGSTAGLKDGVGTAARFYLIGGIAAAPSGNIYVADYNWIRKIEPNGQVSTLVQIGGYSPVDTVDLGLLGELAVDASENIYVSDHYNNKIWKYSNDGKLTVFASGDKGGFSVGTLLTLDPQGNVYIGDGGKIKKITPSGVVSTVAGNNTTPYQDGLDETGTNATFSITGMAADAAGNIYVTDGDNNTAKIRKISPAGVVTTLAGTNSSGLVDGNIGGQTVGNTSTLQIPVTVISTPVIKTVFNDVNIFANSLGKAVLPNYAATAVTTDNCSASVVTVTQSPAAGTAVNVNTTVKVTITATDTGGGSTSVSFNVTAVDPSAPVITPNTSPILIYLDATGHKAVQVSDVATVTSNINPNPYSTISPSSLDCSNLGPQSLTVTANDGMTNPIPTMLINPYGIAVDAQENLYVTDAGNHVIRKITPAGYTTIFAGTGAAGTTDGVGTSASFNTPRGIAIDNAGNLYVADKAGNNIRKITAAGVVTTLAGLGTPGATDGPVATATFNGPLGVAVDAAGNVYVADAGNNKIRRIGTDGMVTVFAGEGSLGEEDGVAAQASFYAPRGIVVMGNTIYVADGTSRIRAITNGMVSTLAGGAYPGASNGQGTAATFNDLHELAATNGKIYAADGGNSAIRSIDITGNVTSYAASAGTSHTFSFNNPTGVAAASSGTIYVVNAADNNIIKIPVNGPPGPLPLTFAPNSTGSNMGNQSSKVIAVQVVSSPVINTIFNNVELTSNENCVAVMPDFTKNIDVKSNCTPSSITVTQVPAAGTIRNLNTSVKVIITATDATGGTQSRSFVVSVIEKGPFITPISGPLNFTLDATGHKTIQLADIASVYSCVTPSPGTRIKPSAFDCTTLGKQKVTVTAFNSSIFTDATPAAASFYYPFGIAADAAGYVYVADGYNRRIRKISPSGSVTTIAGNGDQVVKDGPGKDASFFTPVALAIDNNGNIYVADQNANKIRKISINGVVSTLTGAAARFSSPSGLATDAANNVYVTEAGSHTISKIAPDGSVTTIAGNGSKGFSNGKGTLATFNLPNGIAVDVSGNLYIADSGNNLIRKITTDGTVTTFAGSGTPGSTDGQGIAASFSTPHGLTFDDFGNLLVADQNNNKIRKITPAGLVSTIAGSGVIGKQDGGPGEATFYYPSGLVVGKSGNIFVADSYNNLIRGVSPNGDVTTVAGTALGDYEDGNVGEGVFGASSSLVIEVNILNKLAITSATNNTTVYGYASCPAVMPDFTKTATATGNCSTIPTTFTQTPLAGTTLSAGTTVAVTLTATDVSGATAMAIFSIATVQQAEPSIQITASAITICPGSPVTFTAATQNTGAGVSYKWFVNNTAKSETTATYTTNTLANGDIVTCQLTVNNSCPFTSNPITIKVNPLPVITMATEAVVNNGDLLELNPDVTGNIATYSWTPALGLDNPNIKNPKASPANTTQYQLKVTSTTGCEATATVTVTVLTPLIVPNSFTPNGDNINDLWNIKNIINYTDCYVDVFNRYGQSVFHSKGYPIPWDGKFNGAILPTGTYYYIIKLTKQHQTVSGNISIIR